MAYVLPRAIIVLLCWGLSYGLVRIVIADESWAVFGFTGLSWALAGIVCFGYIRKLRHEAGLYQTRPVNSEHIKIEPAE
jgi:drug/metabolite transporter (DMT)-like permease